MVFICFSLGQQEFGSVSQESQHPVTNEGVYQTPSQSLSKALQEYQWMFLDI